MTQHHDHRCTFCGGTLSGSACHGMQDALRDPAQREQLIQGLAQAFTAPSTKEVVRRSERVVQRVRRRRST